MATRGDTRSLDYSSHVLGDWIIVYTWAPKVLKLIALKSLETAHRAIIIHIFQGSGKTHEASPCSSFSRHSPSCGTP